MDEINDAMEQVQARQRGVDVALAVLAVAACAALVFDLLPAIQLAVQALRG